MASGVPMSENVVFASLPEQFPVATMDNFMIHHRSLSFCQVFVLFFFLVATQFTIAAPPSPNWQQLTPAQSPPERYYPAMAYDPASGKVVLFGGFGGTSYLGDTWTFDGTTWTQINDTGRAFGTSEYADGLSIAARTGSFFLAGLMASCLKIPGSGTALTPLGLRPTQITHRRRSMAPRSLRIRMVGLTFSAAITA